MEDLPTTSSFLSNTEAGNGNVDDTSTLIQHLNITEPIPLLYGACTKPLAELRRTTVAQLRVNESAIGFYILLRTMSPTVAVPVNSDFGEHALVLVEDHVKIRIPCCLYGHVHLRSEPELEELLPVDSIFALKEPFLTACSEQFLVVVGGPSDFVVVGRSHFMYKDAEALGWREKTEHEGIQFTWKWLRIGDNLLLERKFNAATDAYLFALNNCSDTTMELILNTNLATSFLFQDRYESAIKHAQKVLEMEPLYERALYCTGRAQYELRDFTEARLRFETLTREFPSKNHYVTELVRCEERLRESEGYVDIFQLYRASLTDVTKLIDHGNFLRNIVFRPGPGNVRGVFATQDMEPGTLILVDKAVVTISEPSCSSESGIINFMRATFRAVLNNPKTLGRKLRYLPGGWSVTENRRIFCDEVNELEPFVDVRRLYQSIHQNILKTKSNMVENAPYTYHVFEQAWRFRHSCLSNCFSINYNDVVTVRTCATVLEGEELFVTYYGNHLSFREKQQAFELSGFACSCSLCALDELELTEVHDHRQELKTRFVAQMGIGAGVNLSAEERFLPIVNELELSYRNRYSLRVLLFIVYRDLAMVVDRSREDWTDKVTLYVERGLQSVGLSTTFLLSCADQVKPHIPHLCLMPAVLLDFAGLMVEKEYSIGRLELVGRWVKVILLLERIYRGGNIEMTKRRFVGFNYVPSLLALLA